MVLKKDEWLTNNTEHSCVREMKRKQDREKRDKERRKEREKKRET